MSDEKRTLRRRMHGMMFKLPGMISCSEFEDFILEYLDDELPKGKRLIFEMHLKVCRECREYLASYQKGLALLPTVKDDDISDVENVPEDLVNAVLNAIDIKTNE